MNIESAIKDVCDMDMGKSNGWFSFTITYTHISRKQRGKVTCTEILTVNHEVEEGLIQHVVMVTTTTMLLWY